MTVVEGPEALPLVAEVADAQGIEFCVSLRLDPPMVAATCAHGYMPMALELEGHPLLLIKCHDERCVLDFADLHTSASTVRRARGLSLEIDRDFPGCLAATVASHPDRWLVDALCESLAGVFVSFLEKFKKGEARRIVERLDDVSRSPVS